MDNSIDRSVLLICTPARPSTEKDDVGCLTINCYIACRSRGTTECASCLQEELQQQLERNMHR